MPRSSERPAEISGAGEFFPALKIESVAIGIVMNGSYKEAAKAIGVDESTLRVWRGVPAIRERVMQLRQQLNDEKLGRFRARELDVERRHFELIFDADTASTPGQTHFKTSPIAG
jgi:hypothetical protein